MPYFICGVVFAFLVFMLARSLHTQKVLDELFNIAWLEKDSSSLWLQKLNLLVMLFSPLHWYLWTAKQWEAHQKKLRGNS